MHANCCLITKFMNGFRGKGYMHLLDLATTNFERYLAIVQKRYDILEARDAWLRKQQKAVGPNSSCAIATCIDMCPEKERYLRQLRKQISIFEESRDKGGRRGPPATPHRIIDGGRAIKEYSRSAADKEDALGNELRTLDALEHVVDHLIDHVMGDVPTLTDTSRVGEYYNFVWSRTRAVRKDMTQQARHHHHDHVVAGDHVTAARGEERRMAAMLEKCARWHIFCAHQLCHLEPGLFDPKLNDEHLTKCLQALKQLYGDICAKDSSLSQSHASSWAGEEKRINEPEFQAYIILLNLDRSQGDIVPHIASLAPEVYDSDSVKFAFHISAAFHNGDYVKFFCLIKRKASFLQACLLHRYFYQVRAAALDKMGASYRYLTRNLFPLPLFAHLLFFDDLDQARSFLDHFGLAYDDVHVFLEPLSPGQYGTPPATHRESFIEKQLEGDMIAHVKSILYNGAPGYPSPRVVIREPTSSFDETIEDGPYRGQPPLSEFWEVGVNYASQKRTFASQFNNDIGNKSLVKPSPKIELLGVQHDYRTRNDDKKELPSFTFVTKPRISVADGRFKNLEIVAQRLTQSYLNKLIRWVMHDYARAMIYVHKQMRNLARALALKTLDEFIVKEVQEFLEAQELHQLSPTSDVDTLSDEEPVKMASLIEPRESLTNIAIHIYRETLIDFVEGVLIKCAQDTIEASLKASKADARYAIEQRKQADDFRRFSLERRYYLKWRRVCCRIWDRKIQILQRFPLNSRKCFTTPSLISNNLPIPFYAIENYEDLPDTLSIGPSVSAFNSESRLGQEKDIYYKAIYIIFKEGSELDEFCIYQLFPFLCSHQTTSDTGRHSSFPDPLHGNIMHHYGVVSGLSIGQNHSCTLHYLVTFMKFDATNEPLYHPNPSKPSSSEPLTINDQNIFDSELVLILSESRTDSAARICKTILERIPSEQTSQPLIIHMHINANRKPSFQPLINFDVECKNFASLIKSIFPRTTIDKEVTVLSNYLKSLNGSETVFSLSSIKRFLAATVVIETHTQVTIPPPPYISVKASHLVDYLFNALCRLPFAQDDEKHLTQHWSPVDLVEYFNGPLLSGMTRSITEIISKVPQWPPLDFVKILKPRSNTLSDVAASNALALSRLKLLIENIKLPKITSEHATNLNKYLKDIDHLERPDVTALESFQRKSFLDVFEKRLGSLRLSLEVDLVNFILVQDTIDHEIVLSFPVPRLKNQFPLPKNLSNFNEKDLRRDSYGVLPAIDSIKRKKTRRINTNGGRKKSALILNLNERIFNLTFNIQTQKKKLAGNF